MQILIHLEFILKKMIGQFFNNINQYAHILIIITTLLMLVIIDRGTNFDNLRLNDICYLMYTYYMGIIVVCHEYLI